MSLVWYDIIDKPRRSNLDVIHSLSDEEMAKFLEKSYKCKTCCYGVDNICYSEEKECIDGILEWLKKEAKE
jgi:hypothetical protein